MTLPCRVGHLHMPDVKGVGRSLRDIFKKSATVTDLLKTAGAVDDLQLSVGGESRRKAGRTEGQERQTGQRLSRAGRWRQVMCGYGTGWLRVKQLA